MLGTITCQGTNFSAHGISYSQVCGQLRGYQFMGTQAFQIPNTIDGPYVDGISLTYGNPHNHIWTYASGIRTDGTDAVSACPCNIGNTVQTPSFVGNDYYCESSAEKCCSFTFNSSDSLWDGEQCTLLEKPCCNHTNLPWFFKTLEITTTKDIEVRICSDEDANNEDIPLEIIELYIR